MNPRVQKKMIQFKAMAAAQQKSAEPAIVGRREQTADGLSMAIHSQKDADTFMAELKAIAKKSK